MTLIQKIIYGIILLFLLSTGSYLIGYQKGVKTTTNNFNAKTAEVLQKSIDEANKRIQDFNIQQKIDFEQALIAAEERQKMRQNSAATKEDLKTFFKQNQDLYKNCVLPKDQIDKINQSIGGKK